VKVSHAPSSKVIRILLSLGIIMLPSALSQFELPSVDENEREKTDIDDIPFDDPVGLLSFVDLLPVELERVPECIGASSDGLGRECLPNTEVISMEQYRNCEGELATCATRYAYPVPYSTEDQGETVETEIDEAWEAYIDATIGTGNEKLNEAPPCWVPSPCPPTVDWGCVMQRVADTTQVSLTEHNPAYWEAVHESLITHMPGALWWKDPFPELGAVVAPIMTLDPVPDFEKYRALVEGPQDLPYYYQPYAFPNLHDKELRKYALDIGNVLEYQQFGFSGFFITRGELHSQVFFELARGPYMWTMCFTETVPPIPVPLPIPVPIFIPLVPKAFTTWDAVPEGYPIPHVKGTPIWIGQ
jgi:hypothetical protein